MSSETDRLYAIGNQTPEEDVKNGTTLEDKLKGLLVANGLFDDLAATIFDEAMVSFPTLDEVKHKKVGSYPTAMLGVAWQGVRRAARKHLEKHHPQHFARPMFDPELLEKLEQDVSGRDRQQ